MEGERDSVLEVCPGYSWLGIVTVDSNQNCYIISEIMCCKTVKALWIP